MARNSEEQIPENVLFAIAKAELYDTLKWSWLKPILYFLAIEVVVVIVFFSLGVHEAVTGNYIKITLPTANVSIPPLEVDRVSIVVFQSVVTLSGIVIGFFAVSFFFELNWIDRTSENYAIRFREEKNQKARDELGKRRIQIEGATAGLCQYAQLVLEIVIPLLILAVVIFIYCWFSGIFIILNIFLDMNVVAIIPYSLYPLARFIFVFRDLESGKPLKANSSGKTSLSKTRGKQ